MLIVLLSCVFILFHLLNLQSRCRMIIKSPPHKFGQCTTTFIKILKTSQSRHCTFSQSCKICSDYLLFYITYFECSRHKAENMIQPRIFHWRYMLSINPIMNVVVVTLDTITKKYFEQNPK